MTEETSQFSFFSSDFKFNEAVMTEEENSHIHNQ